MRSKRAAFACLMSWAITFASSGDAQAQAVPPEQPAEPAAPAPTEPGAIEEPTAPPPEAEPPTEPPPVPPPTPPPTTPPPAPPAKPAQTAPVAAPPPSSPALDLGDKPAEVLPPPPPERTLGLQLGAGLNARLGGDTSGIPDEEPIDLTYGLGVWFAPARLWSVGLSYQRLGLGGGETSDGEGGIAVQREVDTLWAGGRAYPLRSDTMGMYVALALGASWQQVSANGSSEGSTGGVSPPQSFSCSAGEGPGFALGAAVGLDVDMDRNLAFLAQLDASGHRLTSDAIDGCAPGSGSVTGVGAQIGFMYRFDLDERR